MWKKCDISMESTQKAFPLPLLGDASALSAIFSEAKAKPLWNTNNGGSE